MASGVIKSESLSIKSPLTKATLSMSSEGERLLIEVTDNGNVNTVYPKQIVIASSYIRIFMSDGTYKDIK